MPEHVKTPEDDETPIQRLCARMGCPRYAREGESLCQKHDSGEWFDGL